MTNPPHETPDITQRNIEKIGALFPSVITEAIDEEKSAAETRVYKKAVNFEALKQLLTDEVIEGDEAYEFTWVGKKASIVEAYKSVRKTLRPRKEESRDWETTQNIYIEGDNLEALKLLQESYLGKIKMIYIDPPYNTGNDFVYRDDFRMDKDDYDEESGVFDEEENRLFRNKESNGRFHSDWCSMMYPRLMLARNLLSDDGVIFISIDDNEVAQLRKICDEVFGENNFVGQVIWKNKFGSGAKTTGFIGVHEYIIVYSKKSLENVTRILSEEERNDYNKTKDEKFPERGGYITQPLAVTTFDDRPALRYPVSYNGQEIWPQKQWVWSKQRMMDAIKNNEVVFNPQKDGSYNLRSKKYLIDEKGNERRGKPTTFFTDIYTQNGTKDMRGLFGNLVFDYSKPVDLIKYFLSLEINDSSNKDSLILDFFSGSATTAHAVMQLNAEDGGNRKFIMVQIPEPCEKDGEAFKAGYKNICEIGKERIRRAGDKIREEAGDGQNLDIGFRVFKVDSANMKDVYYGAGEYKQKDLDGFVSNIKDDRSDADLLYSCILEWGIELSYPHKTENIDGFTVHIVNGAPPGVTLAACFDAGISEKALVAIAMKKPLRAVFRDSSFSSSPAKINVFEIFKRYAPDARVKVI
jgi:adenine-specific DNA-methyltransferase